MNYIKVWVKDYPSTLTNSQAGCLIKYNLLVARLERCPTTAEAQKELTKKGFKSLVKIASWSEVGQKLDGFNKINLAEKIGQETLLVIENQAQNRRNATLRKQRERARKTKIVTPNITHVTRDMQKTTKISLSLPIYNKSNSTCLITNSFKKLEKKDIDISFQKSSGSSKEQDENCKSICEMWNNFAIRSNDQPQNYKLKEIIKITEERAINICKCLKTPEFNFPKILKKIKDSDYLCGNTQKTAIKFDWIFKDENFVNILEGKYDNYTEPKKQDLDYELKNLRKRDEIEQIWNRFCSIQENTQKTIFDDVANLAYLDSNYKRFSFENNQVDFFVKNLLDEIDVKERDRELAKNDYLVNEFKKKVMNKIKLLMAGERPAQLSHEPSLLALSVS